MSRLAQRKMLVVGASSGIGLAAAQAFARQGANVALCARRQDRLAAAAGELGEGAFAVPADVRDPESAAAAVETAVECLGGLTDLVYAAGVATLANVAEASAEQWREVFDVNVMGPSLITAAALPHLAAVHGRALYVSSIAAEERPPRRGLSLYSTTKAALNRLIECWQTEQRAVSFTRVSVGDTNATFRRGEIPGEGRYRHSNGSIRPQKELPKPKNSGALRAPERWSSQGFEWFRPK